MPEQFLHTPIAFMLSFYIDPDGDVLATLSEPSGLFAPSASVEELLLPCVDGDGDPPATEDGDGTEENPSSAEHANAEGEGVQATVPPTEYRLRLSSKHLMLASPHIRKMYSGAWKESTLRDEDGRLFWHVGDLFDPGAFTIVMNVIHGLNRKIPRSVDIELLARMAVITDYLQCHESMDVFSAIWINGLRSSIPSTYCRELILWIMVSSVFRDQEAFDSATSTAILKAPGEVPSVGLPIHQRLIGIIEEKRQALLDTLLDALYDTTKRLRAGICCDACDSLLLGSLTRQMKAVDLLQPRPPRPFCGIPVACVAADIANLSTSPWYHPTDVETNGGYYDGAARAEKVKKKKKKTLKPCPEPDEDQDQSVENREGHPCTLEALFSEARGLEAGFKGLDLQAVLG